MDTELLLVLLNVQVALLTATVGWGFGYPPVAGLAVLGPPLVVGLRRFFDAIAVEPAEE